MGLPATTRGAAPCQDMDRAKVTMDCNEAAAYVYPGRLPYNETRSTMLCQSHPYEAQKLPAQARQAVVSRWKMYETWAAMGANGKG
jgi:hypothetical protein